MLSTKRETVAPKGVWAWRSHLQTAKGSWSWKYSMTIVLWIASFVFASQHAYAQGPYCADQKCNTQRIQQPAFYLADSMGLALTASDLMNDQSHQTSYLWLTFTLAETQ